MRISHATYIALLLSLALVLVGCDSSENSRAQGDTLTIYASIPREGPSAQVGHAVEAGARLALEESGGKAGGRDVRLTVLDAAKPGGQTWDPSQVEANAKRAAADRTTIAYLGELDTGASAISVPVTNDAGIVQVSPLDGLTSLTRDEPGAPLATGPERYYPSGRRTFLRIVPPDVLQAETLVSMVRAAGARKVVVVQDERIFGRDLATQVRYSALQHELDVVDVVEARGPSGYPGLARKLAQEQPDAVIYTGLGDARSGALLAALSRALPGVPLYGSSALATAEPTPPGLPPVAVVKPALPASAYSPAARRVLARLSRSGRPATPEALYGYEAMTLILDALDEAGSDSDDRPVVARAALTPRVRRSVLGEYRVLPGGDISTARFGAYRRDAQALDFLGLRGPLSTLR